MILPALVKEGVQRIDRVGMQSMTLMGRLQTLFFPTSWPIGPRHEGVAPHFATPPVDGLRLTPDRPTPAILNLCEWRRHSLDRLRRLRGAALRSPSCSVAVSHCRRCCAWRRRECAVPPVQPPCSAPSPTSCSPKSSSNASIRTIRRPIHRVGRRIEFARRLSVLELGHPEGIRWTSHAVPTRCRVRSSGYRCHAG